jgi:hypothetical protein
MTLPPTFIELRREFGGCWHRTRLQPRAEAQSRWGAQRLGSAAVATRADAGGRREQRQLHCSARFMSLSRNAADMSKLRACVRTLFRVTARAARRARSGLNFFSMSPLTLAH